MDSAIYGDSIEKYKAMISKGGCPKTMLSIKDALEALEGKWKLLILFSLAGGPKRFTEISREVGGITDKTLSKELKSLETNQLVKSPIFHNPARHLPRKSIGRITFLGFAPQKSDYGKVGDTYYDFPQSFH